MTHRYLIVKTSSLGDVVQAFEALEYLKSKDPTAQVDWVAESAVAPLLKAHPLVDHVWEIESRRWRSSIVKRETREELKTFLEAFRERSYDVLFDLQGNTKSAVFTGFAKAKQKIGFARQSVAELPNLLVSTQRFNPPLEGGIRQFYTGLIKSYFTDSEKFVSKGTLLTLSEQEQQQLENLSLAPGKKLLVSLGSAWPNKQISELVLASALLGLLQDFPFQIYLCYGSEQEQQMALRFQSVLKEHSSLLPKLSLPLLQNLMGQVDGFIGMDSLPLHLAASAGSPCFGFFGPTSPQVYSPRGERNRSWQGHCPYLVTFSKRCPKLRSCHKAPCTQNFDVETCAAALRPFLNAL